VPGGRRRPDDQRRLPQVLLGRAGVDARGRADRVTTAGTGRARPFRFAVQAYNADSAVAWRETARRTEALGYSTLHVADHYIGPGPALAATNHPVQVLAAVPAMMMAAEATTTLRVGCRVFCVDYHQPVVLAKELATMD